MTKTTTMFLDALESDLIAAGLRRVSPVTRGRGRDERVELPSGDLLGFYCRADLARAVYSDADDVLGGGGDLVEYSSSERLVVWLGPDASPVEATRAGAGVQGRLVTDAGEASAAILLLVREGERKRAELQARAERKRAEQEEAALGLTRITIYHEGPEGPGRMLNAKWLFDGCQQGFRGAASSPPADLPPRIAECWARAIATGKYVEADR